MKKYAVVTGSTGGIGAQVAKRLADDNWNLLLINRSKSKADAQVQELSKTYSNLEFHAYQADFMDLNSVQAAAEKIKSEYDEIHALYNIAGYMTNNLTHSVQGVESQLAVNTLAPYLLTKSLTVRLAKGANLTGGSHVVNFSTSMISSIKGLDISNIATPEKIEGMGKTYAAAKLVVNVFNRALKDELATQGISIFAVDPGPTKTQMTENMVGVPWLFKVLMPLMTKDVNKQTNKLMNGVKSAISSKQSGVFISEGKVKKEHKLADDDQIQKQVTTLLDKLCFSRQPA
ncbi:SDR family NAD(P)-dependent oxidoreductase [Vibrio maerlii]|uniref:SDR family NAD(P)-dependent oxidoreductase n=1 Tax=Vibrio maerlii TaxID=2231648 RepID=UPI000E3BFDFE|nr:SDR family NAD(P)-dependent oxidoreductase [Vibrio maerlii]